MIDGFESILSLIMTVLILTYHYLLPKVERVILRVRYSKNG